MWGYYSKIRRRKQYQPAGKKLLPPEAAAQRVKKSVIANQSADWCGNLLTFMINFYGFFFYLGDSHASVSTGSE
jgi:hypothetical protein